MEECSDKTRDPGTLQGEPCVKGVVVQGMVRIDSGGGAARVWVDTAARSILHQPLGD